MSQTDGESSTEKSQEDGPADEQDRREQQQEIADVQEKLDAAADGDGLAAEAGRGEEMGLSEG